MMKQIKYALLFLVLSMLFMSCYFFEERENKKILKEAAEVLETNPSQTLQLLDSIKINLLNKSDKAYYILLQVRAWDMAGKSITTSENDVSASKQFFIEHKDFGKTSLACFLLSKIYISQGKYEVALYALRTADEYADKAGYSIPNFIYSAIPYAIAWIYNMENDFNLSFQYLEKTTTHLPDNNRNKYNYKLAIAELKAHNYGILKKSDSAIYYFNQALTIADASFDTTSRNRILSNKCILLSSSNDFEHAENECLRSISFAEKCNDSTILGKLYMTQAYIYYKTKRADSACLIIHQAEKLLSKADTPLKLSLYTALSSFEPNKDKAKEYKRQYDSIYQVQQINKAAEIKYVEALKKHEADMLAMKLKNDNAAWESAQKEKRADYIIGGFVAVCLLSFGATLYWNRKIKRTEEQRIEQGIVHEKEQFQALQQELITERHMTKEELALERKRLLIHEQELTALIHTLKAKEREIDLERMQIQTRIKVASKRLTNEQKRTEKHLQGMSEKLEAMKLEIKKSKEELKKREQALVKKEQELQARELQLAEDKQAFEQWQQSLRTSIKTDLMKQVLLRRDVLSLCSYTPDEDAAEIVRQINATLLKSDWEAMSAMFHTNYDVLYSDLQKDFPTLNTLELKICFLTCVQDFDKDTMTKLLRVTKKNFVTAQKSMEQKLQEAGYSANRLIEYLKRS